MRKISNVHIGTDYLDSIFESIWQRNGKSDKVMNEYEWYYIDNIGKNFLKDEIFLT